MCENNNARPTSYQVARFDEICGAARARLPRSDCSRYLLRVCFCSLARNRVPTITTTPPHRFDWRAKLIFLPPIDIWDSATFEGVSGALLILQSRDELAFYLRISVRHEDSRNCFFFCRLERLFDTEKLLRRSVRVALDPPGALALL